MAYDAVANNYFAWQIREGLERCAPIRDSAINQPDYSVATSHNRARTMTRSKHGCPTHGIDKLRQSSIFLQLFLLKIEQLNKHNIQPRRSRVGRERPIKTTLAAGTTTPDISRSKTPLPH